MKELGKYFLIICSTLWLSNTSVADDNRSLSLVDSNWTLDSGAVSGSIYFLIRADNWPQAELAGKSPVVTDLGSPNQPQLEVTITPSGDQKDIASLGSVSGLWRYKFGLKDFRADTNQKRKMEAVLDGRKFILEYTLSNQPVLPFTWTVRVPLSPWNSGASNTVEIPVITDASPATGIKLLQSTLIAQDASKRPLGITAFSLCATDPTIDTSCSPEIEVPAHTAKVLYLKLRSDHIGNGTFQGNMIISSAQKPAGETFPITLYHSSSRAALGGIAAILAGLMILFLVAVYARYRISRNDEMYPAILLRSQSDELERHLNAALKPVEQTFITPSRQTLQALSAFRSSLSEIKMDQYLSKLRPRSLADDQTRLESYKNFLQEQTKKLDVLRTIITRGFDQVIKRAQSVAAQENKAAFQTALSEIDTLSSASNPEADPTPEIETVLTQLDSALKVVPAASAAPPDIAMLQHLRISTNRFSWLIWIVWFLVTTLTGAAVLIWSDPGFGATLDYGKCFLWGLGVPLAGQQLTQMTGTAPGATIGVKVP